uniref:Uncharacterized protein n=1 Tax=Anopheles darlingi TaxID=43151 RepID=A0A2M4DHS6_ANODA
MMVMVVVVIVVVVIVETRSVLQLVTGTLGVRILRGYVHLQPTGVTAVDAVTVLAGLVVGRGRRQMLDRFPLDHVLAYERRRNHGGRFHLDALHRQIHLFAAGRTLQIVQKVFVRLYHRRFNTLRLLDRQLIVIVSVLILLLRLLLLLLLLIGKQTGRLGVRAGRRDDDLLADVHQHRGRLEVLLLELRQVAHLDQRLPWMRTLALGWLLCRLLLVQFLRLLLVNDRRRRRLVLGGGE